MRRLFCDEITRVLGRYSRQVRTDHVKKVSSSKHLTPNCTCFLPYCSSYLPQAKIDTQRFVFWFFHLLIERNVLILRCRQVQQPASSTVHHPSPTTPPGSKQTPVKQQRRWHHKNLLLQPQRRSSPLHMTTRERACVVSFGSRACCSVRSEHLPCAAPSEQLSAERERPTGRTGGDPSASRRVVLATPTPRAPGDDKAPRYNLIIAGQEGERRATECRRSGGRDVGEGDCF